MILDVYFKRPLIWDYLIATCSIVTLVLLANNDRISLPSGLDSFSLTGDLTNISLTMIGFILTILTVLITFKDNSTKNTPNEDVPAFNKFFATEYYFETIKHLKNCIKSISLIAVLGFSFKLFSTDSNRIFLFYYNVFGLIIVMLTIYRCLFILGKILEFQKTK